MTIEEIKQLQKIAENKISEILIQFSRETRMPVHGANHTLELVNFDKAAYMTICKIKLLIANPFK